MFIAQSEFQESFRLKGHYRDPKTRPSLCQTAGYIPLDVRIKKYKMAGIVSQLSAEMFDSDDYKEIFSDADMPSFEDDKMTMFDKLAKINESYARVMHQKAEGSLKSPKGVSGVESGVELEKTDASFEKNIVENLGSQDSE